MERVYTTDGRPYLLKMGIADPLLPGDGLLGLEISAAIGSDGKMDLGTVRVEFVPLRDCRNATGTSKATE